jgi:hypothetical protein
MSYTYTVPYRNKGKVKRVTCYIAWCDECGKLIEPKRETRSNDDCSGEDYYEHEHPLSFVVLTQSNRGKRKIEVWGKVPRELLNVAKQSWLDERNDLDMTLIDITLFAQAQGWE